MLRQFFYLISVFVFSGIVNAETTFSLDVGAAAVALDHIRPEGQEAEDEYEGVNFSLGVYRQTGEKSFLGTAFDMTVPVSRDQNRGRGRLYGFRIASYVRHWSTVFYSEHYTGVATYEWDRDAIGPYFGSAFAFKIFGKNTFLKFDARYYSDLNYDGGASKDFVTRGTQLSSSLAIVF